MDISKHAHLDNDRKIKLEAGFKCSNKPAATIAYCLYASKYALLSVCMYLYMCACAHICFVAAAIAQLQMVTDNICC